MSDNTVLQNPTSAGDTVRTLATATGEKWAVGVPAYVTTLSPGANVITVPVAAALSDAMSNPTTLPSGALTCLWNGTNWFRAPGDATNGMKVQIATALPAGTNAIGKLAANSGVDIGDVDITSIAAGDNNIGNVDIVTVPADPFGVNADAASATGSISAKLRFIASTGIPVTGISGTISLPTGAATAANQVTANTALSTIAGAISGTEAQVDVITLPSLPAGTNNIGDVDVLSLPSDKLAGGNLVSIDYDSGAGTQSMPVVGLALPGSGGAVAGGTATNPFRTDPTGSTTQPVSGTVTANLGTLGGAATAAAQATQLTAEQAIQAAVEIMDDWDETDRAKVNIIVGQAGVAANAGAASATTPRVILASDDPAVTSLGVIDDWDESDRAKVNLIAGQAGIAAGSGAVSAATPRVILATDDPAVTSLAVIDDWDESDRCKVNLIAGQAGIAAGNGVSGATVPRVTIASDSTGVLGATQNGTWTVQPGNTANTTPWLMTDTAATTGGLSIYAFLSTAAVQAAAIKASAGQVYSLQFFNKGAAAVYVRLYNQTGSPGTGDTPVWRGIIPGNTAGAGFVLNIDKGVAFSTGIGIRVSGAIADNDATVLAANEVIGNVLYK